MRSLVFLFSICIVKCLAMSWSELEEFSNFLEVTSQLDSNVKSKGPEDDYDEDESISDNAWEESGKFEGDLILNERQRRLLVADVAEGLSRNGLQDSTKRWPNNEVIYYIQREHFSSSQAQAIQAGIDDLTQVSCVKFTPYSKGNRDAVVIQGSRRGCFSQVGYQGGYQVLNLSGRHPVGRGCFRHGTIVHELLHSLGFYHMQSSPDRDDYIDVLWQNIIKPARHNFRKYNSFAVNDFGVGYDYESVLHYSRKAFSSNGQDTLVPKQLGAEIGQRVGLSQKDIKKLNKMYCEVDLNDSNVDSDSASKKPVVTKKKSKNKPFDGLGIGYHQGKIVVIKLEPVVELHRLSTLPKFHKFDYFSNAQKLLPQSLASEGPGKMIGSSTFANLDEYIKSATSKSLIQNTEKNGEDFNFKVTTLSDKDDTVAKLVNDANQNQHSSIYDGNLSMELDKQIAVTFEKLSDMLKPLSDSENIYFDKDSNKYYNPESQLHDYSKQHDETSSSEFKHFQNQNGKHNEGNQNIASFLPESYSSLMGNKSRHSYTLGKHHFSPYLFKVPGY